MANITGTAANDTLQGGADADTITGGLGNDLVHGGDGDDSFLWRLGDGRDIVDGGGGADTQTLTTGGGADVLSVVADGDHAIITVRGAQAIDMAAVETLTLRPLGGADMVAVGDLSATAIRNLNLDLAGAAGSPDNDADVVTLAGLAGGPNRVSIVQADTGQGLQVTDSAGPATQTTRVAGLDARDQINLLLGDADDTVTITGPASRARLFIDLGGGDDTAQAAAYGEEIAGGDGSDAITSADGVIANGDAGDDTLTGAINDVLFGGGGRDVLIAGDSTRAFGEAGDDVLSIMAGRNGAQASGGDGDDALFAATGNNELSGGAGADTFTFSLSARDTSQSRFEGGEGDDAFKLLAAHDGVGAEVAVSSLDGVVDIHVSRDDDAGTNIPTDAHLALAGVERLALTLGDGDDALDLAAGLDVTRIDVDLGAGDDTAQAAAGTGAIQGGLGADLLVGADGVILDGGAGADTLSGALNDVVLGGDGADRIVAGASTRAFGGAGEDTLIVAAGKNGAQVSGGDGDDTLSAGSGANALSGDAGDDHFTFALGGQDTSRSAVDGGDGTDALRLVLAQDGIGAHVALSIVAGAADLHVTRDDDNGAHIPTDARLTVQRTEQIALAAGSGADTIEVGDATGAGVQLITIELAVDGRPDSSADTVNLAAPAGAQAAVERSADGASEQVTYSLGGVVVETVRITGLGTTDIVNIAGAAVRDIQGGEGPDVIDVGDPTAQGVSTVNVDLSGADGDPDGAADVVNLLAPANAQVTTALGEDGASQRVTYSVAGSVVATINVRGLDAGDVVNVAGGAGEPTILGTSRSDNLTWTLGDGRKLFDGGAGIDTLSLVGNVEEQSWILVGPNGSTPGSGGVGGNAGLVDFERIEAFNFNLGGGSDEFLNLLNDIHALVRVDAAAGDDMLIGGAGSDVLLGGDGADTIQSITLLFDQQPGPDGNDSLSGDAGDDLFAIVPNAGSGALQGVSTIDGGAGLDVFTFTRNNPNVLESPRESMVLAPGLSNHTLFSFDGAAVADLTGVERLLFAANSTGPDFVTIGDLPGVQEVVLDLGAGPTGLPDHLTDSVTINAASGGSNISVISGAPNFTIVSGLSETIRVVDTDVGLDIIHINGGAGNDTISMAASVQPGVASGGAGNDSLTDGGATTGEFPHLLSGGDGSDTLEGGINDDVFFFSAGETGRDVVLDFTTHQHGTSLHGDAIFLSGFADRSIVDLINNGHIHQSADDVVITDGTNVIVTIRNLQVGDLGGSDIITDALPRTFAGGDGFVI